MLTFVECFNRKQFNQLKALLNACKKQDGNTIPVYEAVLARRRHPACNMLYYHHQKLVGFLGIYFFYESACELSLMIAPDARGQGISRKLLNKSLPFLRQNHIQEIVFSTPYGLINPTLTSETPQFQHTEFAMFRNDKTPVTQKDKSLIVRTAKVCDIPLLCDIHKRCFAGSTDKREEHFMALLKRPERTLFIAELDGHAVGKAHIYWEAKGARFSDIAILPPMQHKGYGRALLSYCINHALIKGKFDLSLDVEAQNQNALTLYQALGFKVVNAYAFWKVSLHALQNGA